MAHVHLRHLNPFPANLKAIMDGFQKILVPELNGGQLSFVLQGRFGRPVISAPKVQGQPYKISELAGGGLSARRWPDGHPPPKKQCEADHMSTTIPAASLQPLTRQDFVSDQMVRWCPGCGDFAILAAVQRVMPELGIARENIVFISGIGCSSRFHLHEHLLGCTASTAARQPWPRDSPWPTRN